MPEIITGELTFEGGWGRAIRGAESTHGKCSDSFGVFVARADRLAYACSTAVDFARLLSRICSVVNSPPQTLQRQPGDAACAISGADC